MKINIINEYPKFLDLNNDIDIKISEYFYYLEKAKVKIVDNDIHIFDWDKLSATLVFCPNDQIRELNNEFRNKDYPTDVLTFCENGNNNYLGDIIISLDKVSEQALEYGHSFERELFFLITHGFLHLLGYDHQNNEDEQQMFELQKKLLTDYGITREYR